VSRNSMGTGLGLYIALSLDYLNFDK
jgi:hypothetical protein